MESRIVDGDALLGFRWEIDLNVTSVWANTSKRNVAKLESIQNFAARIVTGTRKYDHVARSPQQLHWLPVRYTLRYRDTVLAFKCLKGCARQYLSGRFTQRSADIHVLAIRHRNTLEIPFCKTATGQRSFLFRAVKPWNNLPEPWKCFDTLRN